MWRFGVIGDPVARSRSPVMQQAAFDALGLAARYELWPTTEAQLAERIATLRQPEFQGANVTVPHKQRVIPLLDDLAPSARLVGAVNTIVKNDDRLIGHNTDADGLAAALRENNHDHLVAGIILGAGGAARAAAIALGQIGVRHIRILARRVDQARKLALETTSHFPDRRWYWDQLTAASLRQMPAFPLNGTILINATPVGMTQQPGLPLPANIFPLLPPATVIVDLVTRDTPFLVAARAQKLMTLNGLPMLLHQGALAFTLWTGQPAPIEIMRAALGDKTN